MNRIVKNFKQFIGESAHQLQDTIVIDLMAERPDLYSRESRLGDDLDDYTHDIETKLTAERIGWVSSRFNSLGLTTVDELDNDDGYAIIDPSYELGPVRAKLTFTDQESGVGRYGPYYGGHEVVVYCGLPEWSEQAIMDRFDELDSQFTFAM